MIFLAAIRKILFLLVLLCSSFYLAGQAKFAVSGRVVDSETHIPLAFVNIIETEGEPGATTDIDGKFTIHANHPIDTLRLSYVGYYAQIYKVPENKTQGLMIELTRRIVQLPEVVILPTENPAHRIINLVIANRDKNDPEKLPSFSYTAYDKIILTVKMDTLVPADSLKNDTTLLEAQDFLNKQDIAIMESVTERKFMAPDKNYENVKANRVSGFKDPIFVFLISQVQSTSFYKDLFHIGDKYYVNPISKGSTSKYYFRIEDTTYTESHDTVFIISYKPRPNTNFDGMEGLLYINSNGWAIQNVIARPAEAEGFSIKIQQMYELIDGKHWFPVQLNTDVGLLQAPTDNGKINVRLVGIGKSYIRDIVINPELVRRQFAMLGVDVDPKANEKPESFWNAYRVDSLSQKDRRTYEFMDSIGKEANLDRIAKGFETVINGRIPWKFLDFDLDKLVQYNDYEGIYLGLGVHTNEKLSRIVKLGGYWGYGFGDKSAKYGGDFNVLLDRRREVSIGLTYYNDLEEFAGVRFFDDPKGILTADNWRQFLITSMNPTESIAADVNFRLLRDLKFQVELNVNSKLSTNSYRYGVTAGDGVTVLTDRFDFTEVKVNLRFAFREEFITTKRTRISLGTKYPIFWVQYTKGLSGFLGGDFAYNKVDLKIEKSFYTKYFGKTSLMLKAGFADGAVPATNLFNGNGSYRPFMIYAPNSFGTMRMNEFLSDRYVALYFTHSFGKLLHKSEKFQPEFAIVTNFAIGDLTHPENHYNIDYKTLKLGYYESGFTVNNLLNLRIYNIGIGALYRWGPYSLEFPEQNLAVKVTVIFPLNSFLNNKE